MRRLVEELSAQSRLRIRRLRNDKQSARVLVNSVYQPHFRIVRIESRHILQMPGYGIDQRTVEIACTGMDDKPCRLVDDHQHVVFVDNIQRYVLGFYGIVVLRTVEHQRDDILRAHLVAALHRCTVHMDKSGIGRLLNAVAAGMLHPLVEKLVYADRLLALVYIDT